MAHPSLAISRVQYALAYDNDYSPDNLETYLQRRDLFGGLTDEELHAMFAILLHKNDAAGLAALIAAKRQQAEASFGRDEILSLEIHALAKKRDATSAAIVLENNLMTFDANRIATLRAEIAKAQGADPVAEHLRLYETTKTPMSLRALVAALLTKEDYIGIAKMPNSSLARRTTRAMRRSLLEQPYRPAMETPLFASLKPTRACSIVMPICCAAMVGNCSAWADCATPRLSLAIWSIDTLQRATYHLNLR